MRRCRERSGIACSAAIRPSIGTTSRPKKTSVSGRCAATRFLVDAIHCEVVERDRRALVVYGPAHFPRKEVLTNYDMSNWQAQTLMTSLLEAAGIRPFVILADAGKGAVELQPDIASWPAMSLTLVRGTVLGAADFTVFNGGTAIDSPFAASTTSSRFRRPNTSRCGWKTRRTRFSGAASPRRRLPSGSRKRPARTPPICQCD